MTQLSCILISWNFKVELLQKYGYEKTFQNSIKKLEFVCFSIMPQMLGILLLERSGNRNLFKQ